ncbi:MAG TPA: carboxypeptidase-like regulatory domain-containing protein [Candidatus Aquilonibacter sp.]|nr:carboxypeptidase-like regulatory domain-containing protein [Candidatus Aquilonibacter sp.]
MASSTSRHLRTLRRAPGWLAILFVPIFILFGSVAANGQLAGKGQINGTVTDASGAAIPGAQVIVTNKQTNIATRTTSTSAGDFSLPSLDPGDYTVTISANGFQKLVQENVHVNALETQTLSPKLSVGATSEEVTVSAAPPQLETTNATLGATMEQEMYSSLPIEMGAYGQPDQRRATDFAFLMPGVQGNNTNGNATTNTGIVNGSGSRGAVSVVYIDGTPFVRAGGNGDPRYVWTAISVDAVDQFQVQTAGYSAIYEGQGIQNYTVKQGGRDFHGSLYEFLRNTSLDTYGWLGSVPNPATGLVTKPIEHSNEYGIDLGGPLVPFGSWRDKVFFFGNYNGFRYASETPTQMTFPTLAQRQGNFQGALNSNTGSELSSPTGVGIYDPFTQAACTANSTNGPCRYRYGYVAGPSAGPAGNPVLGPGGTAAVDVIPSSEFSAVASKMQSFLPTSGVSTALQNNYVSPNRTGLINWSTTDRIDLNLSKRNVVTMVAAIGRQASSNPVGQTTAGRNTGPIPYNYGQTYAPKTAVGVIEDTFTITPHLVNQLKYGYARYNGPTFDADQLPAYSAATMGITGLPAGAASGGFPITSFAGTNAATQWGGTGPGVTLAENYTLLDNIQWVKGRHNITAGGQIAWLLYNVVNATGGTTPITLSNAVTETAAITPSSNSSPKYAATPSTGLSYASFLVGEVDKLSFTQYLQQEFGARFRAISPYVQDNWKVSNKLTLDLGLRWDYFPTIREVHDAGSFFSPTLTNPVTGLPGALEFTGHGSGTCNCDTPVNNYMKNFGPRIGLAYSIDNKTVIRASWGVMFTHGNAVGGLNTSLGTLGYSAAPSFSATGQLLSSAPLTGSNGAIPAFAPACGVNSGPEYGTGYTTVSSFTQPGCSTASYTGSPSGMGYPDPYLGSRAPEYINWTFGFQHQWTPSIASTITYVGSQGHFLQADGSNARGYWADQLDPKYLSLGSNLSLTGSALTNFCAANSGVCPSYTNIFNTGQSLATLLKPFPFQSVSDSFPYTSNSNYNALQVSVNMRASHGLTFMANYTWSRAIDDGGTFRSGYAIPAAFSGNGKAWAQDRIERSLSTTDQPEHFVLTGVYDLPFGRTLAAGSEWERAVLGGFRFSEAFQAFSGSPLYITAASCGTNPAAAICYPTYNPTYPQWGTARINGKWGQGSTATNSKSYIDSTAFIQTPAYIFGNLSRTAPYDLFGPGNYQLDVSLIRSFPLHFENAHLDFRVDVTNLTNHTFFAVAGTTYGNSNFGTVTTSSNYNRRAAQLSARLSF